MATTYGMGQYRMKRETPYITKLNGETSITPQFIEVQTNTYTYKDIYFNVRNINEDNVGFQYGHTYYLELTLPQHVQYTSNISIKICGALGDETIDIENQYQNIKQITIPNSSSTTNYYKDVLLYEYNGETNVGLIVTDFDDKTKGHIYKNGNNYDLNISDNINPPTRVALDKYQSLKVLESWKLNEIDENIITYKIVFSPKFDSNYPYLYLQIDRNNDWNSNIEYIENSQTYKGLFIDINKAYLDIYEVTNLLGKDEHILRPTLDHIGIWGHPEMYLDINGEQIQIGKNGFYELDDFNITELGVVVKDKDIDRFSIDYEFII